MVWVIWVVRRASMVRTVNDTPLVSMVNDAKGPKVLSDGPRNKYDPGVMSTVLWFPPGIRLSGLKVGTSLARGNSVL